MEDDKLMIVLEEYYRFNNLIKSMEDEVVKNIFPYVIEKHSYTTEYDYEDNNRGITEKRVFQKVTGISFGVSLHSTYFNLFTPDRKKDTFHYSLDVSVHTEKTNICSGEVMSWVWDELKDKIDLDKFPNFKVPKFHQGRQVIG